MPHESARLSTIAPDHGGFSLPKQGQADQAGPQTIAQTRARAYLSGKLTPRGYPQTTATRCAAKVAHRCRAVNPAGKHKFFAHGLGRGVQSGPPFFFRYPPRPATAQGQHLQCDPCDRNHLTKSGEQVPFTINSQKSAWPAVQLSWVCSFNSTTTTGDRHTSPPPKNLCQLLAVLFPPIWIRGSWGATVLNRVVRQNKSRWFLRLNSNYPDL